MSRPARSSSEITTASASWNFSRKRTSIMQVSSGFPHMLTSNQRGRGQDPVTVLGSIRFAVAVNTRHPLKCVEDATISCTHGEGAGSHRIGGRADSFRNELMIKFV